MPINLKTKLSIFLVAALFFAVAFVWAPVLQREASVAHASFLDIIRALVAINPLEISIGIPVQAEIGKVFKVEARVINKGGEKIENAKAQIFLPDGLILQKENSIQYIGVIPGKREKKIFWSVRGEIAGNYIISVLASGELKGGMVSADASTKITLKEKFSPAGPFPAVFQILVDMFRRGFNF